MYNSTLNSTTLENNIAITNDKTGCLSDFGFLWPCIIMIWNWGSAHASPLTILVVLARMLFDWWRGDENYERIKRFFMKDCNCRHLILPCLCPHWLLGSFGGVMLSAGYPCWYGQLYAASISILLPYGDLTITLTLTEY
jgi:hypothetical protein